MENVNQQDCMTIEALQSCMGYSTGVGNYIHPDKLLQLLDRRGIVIAIQTAVPNTDSIKTELLRGRRIELINLIEQLKKVIR